MSEQKASSQPRACGEGFTYHFFLSFSSFDADLATRVFDLLTTEGYSVCFQHRDFQLDHRIFSEINRALDTSERVIAIFTSNYLAASVYTEIEFYAAFRAAKLLLFRFENATVPTVATDQIRIDFPDALRSARSLEILQSAVMLRPIRFDAAYRIYLNNNMPGWKGAGSHADLLGREAELAQLTEAFHDDSCSIACVIADGGFGKSALILRWLADIERMKYLGVQAGFAYSFYKQGWEAGSAMTSAPFFAECLCTLAGLREECLPPGGEEAWAKEIIAILQTRRSLLVLDGLEPHQQPSGSEGEGQINNKTLQWFLKEVKSHVRMRGGLCIVTSRLMAPELESSSQWQRTVKINVGPLDNATSVQAFLRAGLSPTNKDINEWVRQSFGHPLLIALLAPAIETNRYDPSLFKAGHVLNDKQTRIPDAVQRVAVWHLSQLGEKARDVLNSVLVFDRPIAFDELSRLLLDKASIPYFNTSLRTLGKFRKRCSRSAFQDGALLLKKAAMVTLNGDDRDLSSWKLEVHPLVQAGVRRDLVKSHPKAWRKANMSVYLSKTRSVRACQPEEIVELRELYQAVPHGVHAGHGLRAGWMYARRCLRFFKGYSTARGMVAEDVALIANYFEGNWLRVREDLGLDEFATTQAQVWAGLLLNAVNRSKEGLRVIEEGLQRARDNRYFTTATRIARWLGFVYAMHGDLTKGEEYVRHSIEDLSGRSTLAVRVMDLFLVDRNFQRMTCQVMLASILHQQGRFQEAEICFLEAEDITRRATKFSSLRNLWCFRKVAYLCDLERFEEARRILDHACIDKDEPKGWGEGVFVDQVLRLGKLYCTIRETDLLGTPPNPEILNDGGIAVREMEEDQGFRMDWLLPTAKIALSGRARLSDRPAAAALPLSEAEALIKKSENRLFMADLLIEQSRVYLALDNQVLASKTIEEAIAFSESIGYRARSNEMGKIQLLCAHSSKNSTSDEL